ncbi:MAG: XdhC/CoxI family protein [Thermoplasmatales archaeon]|nr:XdhC/CoxI family protein [Thermoplasmatales archaeon]MCW6170142.1 XdhC/CoxI family protein [Thermoplasmatales archaeon]
MGDYDYISELEHLKNEKSAFVVASVVRSEGSALAKPGFRVIVKDDKVVYGSLGGVCPESVIIEEARKTLITGETKMIRIHLETAKDGLQAMISKENENDIYVETFCGGTIDVFLEPYKPSQRLIIFGQGGKDDVENELIALGKKMNFNVVLINHAPNITNDPDEIISDLNSDLDSLNVNEDDFVVVLTKGERDIDILRFLSEHRPSYIGLMASRKRIARDFEELKRVGVSSAFLDAVSAPIGININAVTPFEIALSIASEIVMKKRNSNRMPQNPSAERSRIE